MEDTTVEIGESEYQDARDFLARKTGLYFQENKRGDRKSTRLNSSHNPASRMPSSA
jgi:hypothetical protein